MPAAAVKPPLEPARGSGGSRSLKKGGDGSSRRRTKFVLQDTVSKPFLFSIFINQVRVESRVCVCVTGANWERRRVGRDARRVPPTTDAGLGSNPPLSSPSQFFMALTALAPKTLGVYQVRMFFTAADEDKVGPAAGALSAAFSGAQLATGFFW